MNKLDKILFVFDFDHTIVNGNTDTIFYELLQQKKLPKHISDLYDGNDWNSFMQIVFNYFHQLSIKPNQLFESVINLQLTEGFQQLFHYLDTNENYQCIIASDSNQQFINKILQHRKIRFFKKIYTNPCKIQNDKIHITPYELGHGCPNCRPNMCKAKIIRDYIKQSNCEYKFMMYAGDGGNDYCPAVQLKPFTFCRNKYPLQKVIGIKGNVDNYMSWSSGTQILTKIKELEQLKFL